MMPAYFSANQNQNPNGKRSGPKVPFSVNSTNEKRLIMNSVVPMGGINDNLGPVRNAPDLSNYNSPLGKLMAPTMPKLVNDNSLNPKPSRPKRDARGRFMKSNNNVDAPIAPNLVDKDDLDAGDKEGLPDFLNPEKYVEKLGGAALGVAEGGAGLLGAGLLFGKSAIKGTGNLIGRGVSAAGRGIADVGEGAVNLGKSAVKGVGELAEGAGDAASSLGRGVMSAGKSALKTGGKFAGELAGEVPDILKFGGELAGPLGIAASLLIPDAKMEQDGDSAELKAYRNKMKLGTPSTSRSGALADESVSHSRKSDADFTITAPTIINNNNIKGSDEGPSGPMHAHTYVTPADRATLTGR